MADTPVLPETRTLDQLPFTTAVSPDALMGIQEPGAPMTATAVKQLLGRLISTEAAFEEEAAPDGIQGALDHPENALGLVYADPAPAKNGWYRKVGAEGGGNWYQFEKLSAYAAAEVGVIIGQAQDAADAAAATAEELSSTLTYFPEKAQTNLADPDRANALLPTRLDQTCRIWSPGNPDYLAARSEAAWPTFAVLRPIPLPASTDLVLSMHNVPPSVIAYITGGNAFYKKLNGTYGSFAVTLRGGNREIAMTTPADLAQLLPTVRDTVDFAAGVPFTADMIDKIERGIMVNTGDAALEFNPYAAPGERAPDPQLFQLDNSAPGTAVYQWPYLFVRRPAQLSPAYDQVDCYLIGEQVAQVGPNLLPRSGAIDLVGTRFISRDTGRSATVGAYMLSAMVASIGGDQRTPIKLNFQLDGGTHGPDGRQLDLAAHGLTAGDVYKNGEDRQFVVVYVPDANNFWMIARNNGSPTSWNIEAAPAGLLTKVSGTGPATLSGYVDEGVIQLSGALQNHEKTVRIDGAEISVDGIYPWTDLSIEESYDIGNVASLLEYIVAHPGTTDFDNPAIDRQVAIQSDWRFNRWGGRTRTLTIEALQPYDRREATGGNLPDGAWSMQWLKPGLTTDVSPGMSTRISLYAAGMNPVDVAGVDIDYRAIVDITDNNAIIEFPRASAINPAAPVTHFAHIGYDGGGAMLVGHAFGNHILRADGKPDRAAALMATLGVMSGFEKFYLMFVNQVGAVAVGEVLQVVAWDCWYLATDTALTLPAPIYTVGDTHFAPVTRHGALSRHWVALPRELADRPVKMIAPDANITLHTDTVQSRGVMMSFAGAVNETILQIGGAE
ncbi:hypothetical protein [Sphingopyxis sp. GW247-27LB]|uniref:hypothetical protein n=1 Tax=Sphingopyxis sp. GW247-27LB TaxID=2012632 RepID=UPI000BA707DB|nr:hypothetical protein [Sphingopyxis sp. GW247-27LB]PAL25494.1 hypothetical protein CD928_03200 [Sphingopyxis sp. GW247-27LB]